MLRSRNKVRRSRAHSQPVSSHSHSTIPATQKRSIVTKSRKVSYSGSYSLSKHQSCSSSHSTPSRFITIDEASAELDAPKEPLNKNEGPIRVRFAPSPTGTLHLGGLRTALYNYLFAKHRGGDVILRIEDTDRTRLVPGAMQSLMDDMKWIGIKYNEGPQDIGGKHGPYVQSERLPYYKAGVQKLLDNGHAYRCFCTPERLDSVRTTRGAKGEPMIYDRLCSTLTPDQVKNKMEQNIPHVIRMKMPNGITAAQDMVRGEVVFQNSLIDDQVLMKSDGYPTYHLANIIDDHAMRITHVIRGEEWLPSLPKHIALYNMFGWEAPAFAHLPLLLREDGGKLSKRFKDSSLNYYVEMGFLPEAIINFVALLGWHPTMIEMEEHAHKASSSSSSTSDSSSSTATVPLGDDKQPDINQLDISSLKSLLEDDKSKIKRKTAQMAKTSEGMNEIFNIDELSAYFKMDKMQKSGAIVEMNKLKYFQSQHWKLALNNDITRLAAFSTPRVHDFIKRWKNGELTENELNELNGVEYDTISCNPIYQDDGITETNYTNDIYHAALITSHNGIGQQFIPNRSILNALKTTRDHPCTLAEFPVRSIFVWARPKLTTQHATDLKQTFWITKNHAIEQQQQQQQQQTVDTQTPPPSSKKAKAPKAIIPTTTVLTDMITLIQSLPDDTITQFDVQAVISSIKAHTKTHGVGLKEIYMPLRFALSGTSNGPGVADQICAIGKDEAIQRIKQCLDIHND